MAYYAIIINRGCNGASGGVGTACDNKNWEKVSISRGPTRGVIETAEVKNQISKVSKFKIDFRHNYFFKTQFKYWPDCFRHWHMN